MFFPWALIWFDLAFAEGQELDPPRDTFGVLTREEPPVRIYLSPLLAYTGRAGARGVDVEPDLALGAETGALFGDQFLLGLYYLHSRAGFYPEFLPNAYPGLTWQENSFGALARLFVFGRDSFVRPFLGGGAGWSRGEVIFGVPEFRAVESPPRVDLDRICGFGEVGAELKAGRSMVVVLRFRLTGVVTGAKAVVSGGEPDPGLSDLAASVARSSSYLAGVGLGIYF